MKSESVNQQGASVNRASDNELLYVAIGGCGCTVDLVWCSACANALARKAREGGELANNEKSNRIDFVAAMFNGLKEAMRADPEFAWSWHCNLAMVIYDESHPQCFCESKGQPYTGHLPGCAIVRAHDARHFNEHALSPEFCNNAAARFMKLCFDVDTSKVPSAPSTTETRR